MKHAGPGKKYCSVYRSHPQIPQPDKNYPEYGGIQPDTE
jgi:hypothetical protein